MHRWQGLGHPGVAVLICLLALLRPASADDFRVGVEDVDYLPIMGVSNGNFSGYAHAVLELFASQRGHRFTYVPLPIKRITPQLLDGQLDLSFPDNPNWRQDIKQGLALSYTEAFVPFQDVVFVMPEHVGQPLKTLGVVRGFTPKRFQQQMEAGQLAINEATAPANLVKMVLARRIDGVVLAWPVGAYQLRQLGQAEALRIDPAHSAKFELHYRLSTLRHPQLVAQFNEFLKGEQAALMALQKQYGLKSSSAD